MRTVTTAPAAAPEETPFPEPLRLRLCKRVLALDYAGCVLLLARLLAGMGYEDVVPAGRLRLKGYNRPGGGGWDLAATLPAGVGSRRVIVRLKHVPRGHSGPEPKPVHNRCVDELRGAVLRAGASEGLMVSTAAFSLTARSAARAEASGVAPVRLVDGDELVELLLANRVGVRETTLLGRRRLALDEGLFAALDDLPAQATEGRPRTQGRSRTATRWRPGTTARRVVTLSLGRVCVRITATARREREGR